MYIPLQPQRLGNPAAIIASAPQIIKAIEGLFSGSHTMDANAKAVIDSYITAVMAHPSNYNVPGTNENYNWMKLRCCSGDTSADLLRWEQTTGGDPSATACGCSNSDKRDYARWGLNQVQLALQGKPLTPPPVSGSNPPPLPGVTLKIPTALSQMTIFGIPVVPLGIGIGVFAFMSGKSSRGRR